MKSKSLIAMGLVLVLGAMLFSVPALAKQAGSGLGFGIGRIRGPQSGLNDAGKALGMDADALRELRLEGKSLAEIAEENGITKQSLVEKLVAIKSDAVDKLVDEGKIGQETAELFLEGLAERIEASVDKTEAGQGGGRGNGAFRRANRGFGRQGTGFGQGCGQCYQNQSAKDSGK